MKSLLRIILPFALLAMCGACTLPGTETAPGPAFSPEPTAAPIETVAPTAAVEPSPVPTATAESPAGIDAAFANVRLRLPHGLATGITGQVVPSTQGSAEELPFWEIHPTYAVITLTGYASQNTYFAPHIAVYPAAEFAGMNEGAARNIAELRSLLQQRPEAAPQHLPMIPVFNAAQIIHAQMRYVDFQNGAGVRYLAQYGQAYMPINNQELFYTFQGLTADGAHCVVAILPVSATFLPATFEPDAPVPPDGVPFPGYHETDTAKIEAYYEAVAAKLEQAPDGSLAPDLLLLDALIQSVLVQP
ncbi:MAG: hypothetical protein ACUVX9_11130 [Anaerolineae bacterium]